MSRNLTRRLATLAAAAWLVLAPARAEAQKALVYCPVGIDATGCNAIVATLSSSTLFPDGVDAGYDGSGGTVDLAGDLSGYAVFVVPSLADGADVQPYSLLRNATIAARLQAAFMGRVAVWSGTPDIGSTNRAAKDNLIRNLAGWARADAAGTHGPGVVALQDNSDDEGGRYGWVSSISGLSVAGDPTFDVYSNVQVVTATGQAVLTSGGLQIGYTNMASYGLVAPGASNDATGARSARVVLVTVQGDPSDPNLATVVTDKDDYQPGDTVTVTGSGWEPGETVSLLFHEDLDPPVHPDKTLTAVADADGRIVNRDYLIDEEDLNVRFTLQATGLTSGKAAQTTFTDAVNFQSVSVGAQTPTPIAPGSSATYTISVGFSGNNTPTCSVALSVTTVLPSGATASFSPSSVASPNGANQTSTLTITTGAATPTGVSTFNVRGIGTGCTGTNNATGTLDLKRPSTSTVTGPATSAFGGAVSFTAVVTGAGGTPTGTVQFKDGASNLGALQTLSGGTASLSTSALTVGGHSITAVYSGDGNYTASTSAGFTHTVSKANQTISFTSTAPVAAAVGGATYTAAATATSGLTVAFTSQTPAVCTSSGTNGSAINFVGVGSCTVAANQVGNGNFNAAPQVTQTFAVGPASQTITFTSTAPAGAVFNGPTYTVTASGGGSGNPVTFSSLTGSVCTSSGTSGATISFVGVGTCTVAADQAGNANYNAAAQATQSFPVGKAGQTITFSLGALPAKTFGDADFSVSSFASASSGLAVEFSSGSPTRCTVTTAGLIHIITAAGNCMVVASQPGNANYNAAADVQQTFNVAKAAQTVSFTSTAPVGAIVGGPTYAATATASSGLPVIITSTTTGVCTIAAGTVTFVGGGTCTLAANQPGNGDYNAAPQVTQSFAVSAQAPQTITFTSVAPSNAVFGGTYLASATATSGLTVAFSSLTTGVCTVTGGTVSFVGVGPCTVAANQPGNASFLAAPQVTQSFAVGKADQTITFAGLADKTYGDADFGVSATASSTLAVTFAASGNCTVTGTTVHLTGAGSCTITASQAGNANYNPATDVPQSFTIAGAPVAPVITVDNKTYDGTTDATILTRGLSGIIGTDDVTLTGGTAAFTTKHAGAGKAVTASGFSLGGSAAANYVLSPTTAATTANIARLAITVTAATDSREYDGTDQSAATPTVTTGSIQTGDAAAFIQTFDNKNVGTGKTLTPTGSVTDGNSGLNYMVSFQPVTTGEISAKALTGSITVANKPYDGNTSATILTRTLVGVIGTENVTYVGGTATFNNRNAGTAKPVNATGLSLGGGAAGNYTVNSSASTTANIDQLPITVTAATDSKTYDGTTDSDETPVVSVNAIISPDVAAFSQTFDNKNAGTGKTLTPTGAVTDGNAGGNYLVTFVPVTTGTILQRTLTVAASASSKQYDGNATASVTLSDDRVTDDVFTVIYATALFDDKNVGTGKTVTVSGLGKTGTDADNYALASPSVTTTADISPVTLTGSFTADNKVYDGNTAATILTRGLGSGIIGTEDVTLAGGTATFADKNVGSPKTVTGVGFSLAGVDHLNYVLASTTLTTSANITRRDLTVAATGVNKTYDGTTAATVTLSDDRVTDDVFTESYASAAFADKNVGNGKPISVSGISISGGDAGNYTLLNTTASANANITVATAVGHFTAANKTYDGTTGATILTRTLTSTFGTDVVSLTGGSATFADKHAGVGKTVTGVGFSLAGADAPNYVLASSTLTAYANIDQRLVTVAADAKSKIFGQGDPPLTYQITSGSLVSPDGFSGALTRAPGEAVGSYAILQGSLTLGPDYNLSYTGANLSINPWTLTGFYAPVDMPTGSMMLNSIRGGQTVPLKFEIFAGTVEKTDVSAVQGFVLNEVACPTSSPIDDIELTTTGSTVLRYDGSAGQFIQNWQTPKTAGKCYKVTVTAADAVSKVYAYFKTK